LADARRTFPTASILSEDTGHRRDYRRNPYAGYENDNRFVFEPSNLDTTLPPKTIMLMFYSDDTPVAIPWNRLREIGRTDVTVESTTYVIEVSQIGEVTITESGTTNTQPFYFEMWFSAATQHGENIILKSLE
jgi:hypothetical protein